MAGGYGAGGFSWSRFAGQRTVTSGITTAVATTPYLRFAASDSRAGALKPEGAPPRTRQSPDHHRRLSCAAGIDAEANTACRAYGGPAVRRRGRLHLSRSGRRQSVRKGPGGLVQQKIRRFSSRRGVDCEIIVDRRGRTARQRDQIAGQHRSRITIRLATLRIFSAVFFS